MSLINKSCAAAGSSPRARKRTLSTTEADPPVARPWSAPGAKKASSAPVISKDDKQIGKETLSDNETEDEGESAQKIGATVPAIQASVRRGKVSKFQPKVKAKS